MKKSATSILISPEYRQFVEDLKARVIAARISAARTVNKDSISLYWDIGCGIVEKQKTLGWGDSVVEMISTDLRRAFPLVTGFSANSLWLMRQFYLEYANPQFLEQVVQELKGEPGGHFLNDLFKKWRKAPRSQFRHTLCQKI